MRVFGADARAFEEEYDDEVLEEIYRREKELDSIRSAIEAIQSGGQEYRIGNRMLRRADLQVLYKEKRQLEYELNVIKQQAGGGMYAAAFYRD